MEKGIDKRKDSSHPSVDGNESVKTERGTNKYQMFLEKPYEEIKSLIKQHIDNGNTIIDLGCNNGNLEDQIESSKSDCEIYAVDTDPEALKVLGNKKYINNKVKSIQQDANEFMSSTEISDADTLLAHATIHEINDPTDQSAYLDEFFQNARRILGDGGKIIIGDLYYDPSVSDKEVEDFMKYQKQAIGHADSRNKFIMPELLKVKAEEHGFLVVHSNEFRAVNEIDRRYYSFVFSKNK